MKFRTTSFTKINYRQQINSPKNLFRVMEMYRKSKLVQCEICGKLCYARGIKSHIRLKHELKITHVTSELKLPEMLLKLRPKLNDHIKRVIESADPDSATRRCCRCETPTLKSEMFNPTGGIYDGPGGCAYCTDCNFIRHGILDQSV